MTVDRFLPNTRPMAQPQQPQGKDHTPPPPSTSRAKKKQCANDQPPKHMGDAPSKTLPLALNRIVIKEPVGDSQPAAQVGTGKASSSQAEAIWQPNFKFGDRPLQASASIRA